MQFLSLRAPRPSRLALRFFPFALALIFATSHPSAAAPAKAPEWELPSARRAEFEKRLTPLASILSRNDVPSTPSDSGAVLLSERIVLIDDQGRRTSLHHSVYKTLNDAGVAENSEEIIRFRKREQRAYLLVAETIQPDGSRQPVKPDAVFLQSPQRQAQYSLYDDQAELKVIFPNVKPGSITRLVCVIEDQIAKIPGEFQQSFTWGGSWAAGLIRSQIELPASFATRLQIAEVGAGIPIPTIEKLPAKRLRYTWTRSNQPGRYFDDHTAPTLQVGPALNLTTLKSWDDIGRWYRQLLAGRSELGPALTKAAAAWTAQATTPAEILAALHTKVADDVRYVGLEFGAADYQPHRCDDVWENQYGDCKDKANLLASLLRHRGVKAFITLVNTEHVGLVDRRSPDYRPFNHAIVAVPQPDGGYIFCDPTISYSQPGQLSPGDSDRDVLVIADDHVAWVHTPPQSAGTEDYNFDLKLTGAGELSGWLTLTSTGYYGAAERANFARLDTDDTRSRMSKIVRGFFDGADVVDVTRSDAPSPAPYVVKAYFLVNGKSAATDGQRTLTFPTSPSLFNDLGDRTERDTTVFVYRDRLTAEAAIALPAGLRPVSTPPLFRSETPASSSEAQWTFADGTCRTRLTLELKDSALRPDAFKSVYQSQQALKAWLAQSVVLTTDPAAATTAAATPEIDLPMMPTVDGQIELLDKRYPDNGNLESRRLALERAAQYFPNDKAFVFRIGARLAMLEWDTGKLAPAHDRLHTLLTNYAGQIKPDIYSWAEVSDALILRDLKRTDEAIAGLRRVARDTALSDFRRVHATTNLVDLIASTDAPGAIALLTEVSALPEGATSDIESRLAALLLAAGQLEPLRLHLAHLASSRPDSAEELFTQLLDAAASWHQPAAAQHQQSLVGLIDTLFPSPHEALRDASRRCHSQSSLRQVHAALLQALAQPPLAAWAPPAAASSSRTAADHTKAIENADTRSDSVAGFRATLDAAVSLEPDSDFSHRLWRAASYAEWVERQNPDKIDRAVGDALIALCDQLPVSDRYFFEGKFLRAKRLVRDGDRLGQQKILREIIAHPASDETFKAPALRNLGQSLEATRDFAAALEAYRAAEPMSDRYTAALDCQLHAVFINLAGGHDEEALRLLALAAKSFDATRKDAASPAQLNELISLAQSGHAPAFWQASRRWWPAWKRFAATAGFPDAEADVVVPEIPDLVALGREVDTAKRAGNLHGFLSAFATAASAARWQPSLATEAAYVVQFFGSIAPTHLVDFRRLLIAMLSSTYPPELTGLRNRQLYLAAFFIDDQRPLEALRIVREFNAVPQPLDQVARVMHRLHALAALATGEDLAPAATALAADYADPEMTFQRVDGAILLADLYHRLDRRADEEQLLTRELADPKLTAAEDRKKLTDRRQKFASDDDFTAKVDAWLKTAALPWYDLAEPQNLDDPRLRDLDAALRDESTFHPVENVKLHLLAARSPSLPIDRRRAAFRDGVRGLINLTPDYRRADMLAASVIDDSAFDDETRLQVLWGMLASLGVEDAKEHYAIWRHHALNERFSDNYKKNCDSLDHLIATDRADPAAVLALIRTLTSRDLNSYGLFIVGVAFGDLLNLGRLDDAAHIIENVSNWKFTADVTAGADHTQLDLSRRLRTARATSPVHEAMIAAARTHFATLPDQLPEEYRHLRHFYDLPVLDRKTTLRACLAQLRRGGHDRTDLGYWRTFFEALYDEPDRENIALDLLHAGLSATTDDEMRAELFSLCIGYCDTDSPSLRTRLEAEFAPYRRATESPRCYARIRVYELNRDARLGVLRETDTTAADLHDAQAARWSQTLVLRTATRRGDRAAVQRLVDSIDTNVLLESNMLDESIAAFRLLGMKTEERLATNVAQRELRSSIVNAWATQQRYLINHAIGLANLLENPALLPDAWLEQLAHATIDPLVSHEAQMTKSFLLKDWPATEQAAAALNREFPTHYRYYWHRGYALHELGRDEEAKVALTLYTRFAKNEAEFPQAVALLEKLGGHAP